MALELASFQSLWPLLSRAPWLASLALSWYFTANRLASLVYVDLFPRHESARVDLAGVASFQLVLHIINLSPFEMELDRANFEFWCAGTKLQAHILKKQRIASGASMNLYVSGPISNEQADQIALLRKANQSTLNGNIEFNSRVRSFAKDVGTLSSVQVAFINTQARDGDA